MNDVLEAAAEGRNIWSGLSFAYRKELIDRVLHFYEAYVQEESSDPDAQFEAGVAYIALGNMAAANRDLERSEMLLRRSTVILARLAELYPLTPEYRQQWAWASYRLALTLAKRDQSTESEAVIETALKLYRRLISEGGPDMDDYAIEVNRCIEALEPLRTKRGAARSDFGREMIAMISELGPKRGMTARGYMGLAALCEREQMWDEAISASREQVRCQPDEGYFRVDLARALERGGRFDEALAVYEEANREIPNHNVVLIHLGNALIRAGRLEDAIPVIRNGIERYPDAWNFQQQLCKVLTELGRLDEAIAELQNAARQMPDASELKVELSGALVRRGRYDEAIAVLREALKT